MIILMNVVMTFCVVVGIFFLSVRQPTLLEVIRHNQLIGMIWFGFAIAILIALFIKG